MTKISEWRVILQCILFLFFGLTCQAIAQTPPAIVSRSATALAAETRATNVTPSRSSIFRQNSQRASVVAEESQQSTPKPSLSSIKDSQRRSAIHGNSKGSNKINTIYLVTETDKTTGKTLPYKVGISSQSNLSYPGFSNTISRRAISQTRALNATSTTPVATNFPNSTSRSFSARNVEIVRRPTASHTTRELALNKEKNLVTALKAKHGVTPPGNQLPAPNPASSFPRRSISTK